MRSFNEALMEILQLQEKGEDIAAYELAKEVVKINRLNLQANLLRAETAYRTEKWLESYEYFNILNNLQKQYKEPLINEADILDRIDSSIHNVQNELASLSEEELKYVKEKIEEVHAEDKSIVKNIFTTMEDMEDYFGEHTFFGKKYYMGRYDNWFCSHFSPNQNKNGYLSKAELFEIEKKGREFEYAENQTCILPIVANTAYNQNNLRFCTASGEKTEFVTGGIRTYSYYRLNEPCSISADDEVYFGKPIPLKHHAENKKLVLNIFIDSFNWKFIKRHSLKEMMPYTYDFFKEGVICDKFFAGSEFTYPSVASYWTGLRATTHGVLNQNLQFPIPEDKPLLSEIFKDHGYVTAKIGGNDSVVPNYGYIRGIDRFVYEKFEQNFHVQDTVAETIEQLEAFDGADQFIWAEVLDMHEVAGYWPMPLSVQTKLPISVNQVDNLGGSSLYQTYSPNRSVVYGEQLKRVDKHLHTLYEYIKSHYAKDEVVVTLMSDHGNGFNVDTGQPFMSDQRENVPLMIYGAWDGEHACDEKIESIDYGHILCKLAGIEDERIEQNEGQLPKFFGGEFEKEWVFSQSLFPNRKYNAGIIGDGFKFYLESRENVTNDCRVNLRGSAYWLYDEQDKELHDEELADQCFQLVVNILDNYLLG